MKHRVASSLKTLVSLVPPEVVRFTYLKLFRPRPLRFITDTGIKFVMPEKLELEEGVVNLDKNDVEVCGALALGAHDPFEIEVFRSELRPGMNVVDIGANIGYYTVIAGNRVGASGRVFAYEPVEKNFDLLKRNIADNQFSWITAIQTAVSDKPGMRTLFLAEKHTGIHSFANNRNFGRQIDIQCDTLDNSLSKFDSPKIDVIKMDIEGAEILAIEGMAETIRRSSNLVMFTEFYPQAIERLGRKPIEFLQKLNSLGFKLGIIDEAKKSILPLYPGDFMSFTNSLPRKGEVVRNLIARKNS